MGGLNCLLKTIQEKMRIIPGRKHSITFQLQKTIKAMLFCFFFSTTVFTSAKAQANLPIADSALIGRWKGSSLCQIKNSPCHDETVVYYISKAVGIDSFSIRATKIVNGAEEDMGTLNCKFERKTKQLISTDYKALWTFNVNGKSMDGRLMFRGALYRIIKLVKQG